MYLPLYAYGISTIVTTHMDQFSCSLINYETAVLSIMKVTSFPEVNYKAISTILEKAVELDARNSFFNKIKWLTCNKRPRGLSNFEILRCGAH